MEDNHNSSLSVGGRTEPQIPRAIVVQDNHRPWVLAALDSHLQSANPGKHPQPSLKTDVGPDELKICVSRVYWLIGETILWSAIYPYHWMLCPRHYKTFSYR